MTVGQPSPYSDSLACWPGITALPEMLVDHFRVWVVGEGPEPTGKAQLTPPPHLPVLQEHTVIAEPYVRRKETSQHVQPEEQTTSLQHQAGKTLLKGICKA